MIRNDWDPGRAVLERVVQEYRERGYEVVVSPTGEQVPDFIREYQPDAIARSDKESVVIELNRPPASLPHGRLRTIAKRVANRPGWRLMLIAPGATDVAEAGANLRPLARGDIDDRLREVSQLQASGHQEAALLLAWATVEAIMRHVAGDESPEGRGDTWKLMRELASEGVLDADDYRKLTDLFRLRSVVAHGLEPSQGLDRQEVQQAVVVLTRTARMLMAELPSDDDDPSISQDQAS